MEQLKQMSLNELMLLLPAIARRKLKRGFSDKQKKLLDKINGNKSRIRTHCRDMIILPMMVGKTIFVHSGNSFTQVIIQEDMIGHSLGEFALTRKKVRHSAPGIGATKSSANLSVK